MVKFSQAEKELNKATRAKARQKRGSLRHNQVSESVLKRYVTAIAMLQAYWRAHEIDAPLDDSFDFCMGDYIEHLYSEGEAKGCGTDVLAALQYFIPKVIGKLKYSWKLLGIWKRLEPPNRATPFTPIIVLGLAGLAASLKLQDVCALFLVGFDRFLRTGELLNLRVFNIQFGTSKAVITLHDTKTGKRKGSTEMVSVSSPLVIRWLRKACAGKRPDDLLLNRTYYQFRMLFKQLLCHFDIDNLKYNLYNLRRGGCTSFFFESGSLDLTVEVGRWSDSATARIYKQNAAAESVEISLSARQNQMLTESAKALKNCI